MFNGGFVGFGGSYGFSCECRNDGKWQDDGRIWRGRMGVCVLGEYRFGLGDFSFGNRRAPSLAQEKSLIFYEDEGSKESLEKDHAGWQGLFILN